MIKLKEIKKGDIVKLKNDNNNDAFYVTSIITNFRKTPIVFLKGITIRIETSTYLNNIEIGTFFDI